MIPTTPYESDLSRRCQSGELCPRILDHGDFCGRKIHDGYGLGLCEWHSESDLGLPHASDPEDREEFSTGEKVCIRCQKRPVAYRVTRMCGNCQKVMHRQHVVSDRRRETK